MILTRILLGVGLGFVLKGPVGAILDRLLEADDDIEQLDDKQQKAVYHAYLVSLFTYIAKADGHISPVEVRIIRDFFQKKGLDSEEMLKIKEALKIATKQKDINIETIIDQINQIFDYPTKYSILELCYHIAAADKVISDKEHEALEKIGNLMRISQMDQYALEFDYGYTDQSFTQDDNKDEYIDDELERLKREMRGDYSKSKKSSSNNQNNNRYKQKNSNNRSQNRTTNSRFRQPWEVLGVDKNASKKEIKKQYLKMVSKYHPDKFSDPKEKAEAEERIKEINVAYQKLKNRG